MPTKELALRLRDQDCDGVENQPLRSVDLIKGGEFVTCIFDTSGAIRCAGQNHLEQTSVPQDSMNWDYRDWRSMDIGFSHGCGLSLSGDLRCWLNHDGRGTPAVDENDFDRLWSHVTTGFAHTCALTTAGVPFLLWGKLRWSMRCSLKSRMSVIVSRALTLVVSIHVGSPSMITWSVLVVQVHSDQPSIMPTAISQLQLVVNTPVHSKSLAR